MQLPALNPTEAYLSLQSGKILLLPVDTLLGLAVRADDPRALERLYRLKNRDAAKPFALAFSSLAQAFHFLPHLRSHRRVLSRALPGPWTFVMDGHGRAAHWWKGWSDSIGIRVPGPSPSSSFLQSLPWPIALTSANDAGKKTARQAHQLPLRMAHRIAGYLPGKAPLDKGSTIVDLREHPARLLREGAVSQACCRRILKGASL